MSFAMDGFMKVDGEIIKFTASCAFWGMALVLGLPAQAQPVIAIDAGHVKAEQGARAAVDGRSELLFNIDMAKEIAKEIERLGAHARLGGGVVMEREDFRKRTRLGQGADFFLSVHHDSAKPTLLTNVRDGNGECWEDRAGRFKGFALFVDPKDGKGLACARWIGKSLVEAGEKPSRYHGVVGSWSHCESRVKSVAEAPGAARKNRSGRGERYGSVFGQRSKREAVKEHNGMV